MGYSNGIVTAPVSVYDIRNAVGHSSGDLGTLISSGTINKWAKYKPVRRQGIEFQNQWDSSARKWKNTATWWKGDGLCGMTTQVSTEFGSITNSSSWAYKLINGLLGWTYQKPQGGSNSPYRYTDFAQYYRDAIAPYGEIGTTNIYVTQQWTAQIDWEVVDVDDLNLKLSDIVVQGHTLTDFYLGLILWNGSTYYLYTSSSKFSTGASLSITLTNISSGMLRTWNCMPFFSLYQVNGQGGFDANGLFISMADTTPISITLSRDGSIYMMLPYGQWNSAGTQVSYEILVINDTSVDRYFTVNISIMGGSHTGADLGHVTRSNMLIARNQTTAITGTINASRSGYNSYWIVASIPNSTIETKYAQVDEADEPLQP